jgi:hypothetical protein
MDVLFCGLKASSVGWTSFMETQGKVKLIQKNVYFFLNARSGSVSNGYGSETLA